MSALLPGTNIVSILFNKNHRLRDTCLAAVTGHELAISFMSRAELLLWPEANFWGEHRRSSLLQHLSLYATLYPDEVTCSIWVEIVTDCRRIGRPVQTADAWIAAVARQWNLPLITTDIKDFKGIHALDLITIR